MVIVATGTLCLNVPAHNVGSNMQPSDRVEARVLASDIPDELKWDILNSIKWYRRVLYDSIKEKERLEKALSDERWKTAICTGSY